MTEKRYNLFWALPNSEPLAACGNPYDHVTALSMLQVSEAPAFEALEVGQSLVDRDGDIWERIA